MELCALHQIMLNVANPEESFKILLVYLCFVHDLFNEFVSYTMYSIERYVDW